MTVHFTSAAEDPERRAEGEPLRQRRVVIICQIDGFANGVRPQQIRRVLEEHGHEVEMIDTYHLSRASTRRGSLPSKMPAPRALPLLLYAVEVIRKLTNRTVARRYLTYWTFMAEQFLRRNILRKRLAESSHDLLIVESTHDGGIVLEPSAGPALFDCPTPFADELLYEGNLTIWQHRRLRSWERRVCEAGACYAYWWESYTRYVVDEYGADPSRAITLNYGCCPSGRRARPSPNLRVAYIGSLSSRFIDLELLSRLTELYPHIDVYGAPAPDPALRLNYRGYTDSDILAEYQFGLITCTDDPLRRNGFSAKHIEYLSYGLPVLVPAWRTGMAQLDGSVPYAVASFRAAIESLRDEREWQRVSDAAFAQGQQLAWDVTLQPLLGLLGER